MVAMLVIGHRGAKGEAPENTIAAIKQGLASGADAVEFDLRATRDGRVVLSHDAWLSRTHDIRKRITHQNFATLRKSTETKNAPLATLEEVLDVISDCSQLCIEIKRLSAVKPTLKILAERFPTKKTQGKIFIESFSLAILRRVRRLWPHARLGFLLYRSHQAIKSRHGKLNFYAIVPNVKCSLARYSKYAKHANLKLYVYNANDEKAWHRAQNYHADAIITDFPSKAKNLKVSIGK